MVRLTVGQLLSTVNFLELFWLIICGAGLAWAIKGLRHWHKEDDARAEQALDGPLKIFYRGKIRLYRLGITKLVLYFAIGVQSALLPDRANPLTSQFERHVAQITPITTPIILIVNVILLGFMLGLDDRDRDLMDIASRREKRAEELRGEHDDGRAGAGTGTGAGRGDARGGAG